MADTKQCSFCCDRDAIKRLSEKYSESFDEMARMQTEVDSALSDVANNGCLKGQWFTSFLTTYNQWSENYTRILASLLLLYACLMTMDDCAAMLIENRDGLNSYLS